MRIHPHIVTSLAVALLALEARGGTAAYTDQSIASGLVVSHDPVYFESFLAGGVVGDFDRDGFQDVFVPVGGGGPDRLYINDGDGTFTDRAAEWGIALTHRSTSAAVGDYDGDGWLDLFVTSLGPAGSQQTGFHKLYCNDGGGTFTDRAAEAGVNQSSVSAADGFGGAWGDYDLDGDLDLAVSGWITSDGNRLYRNDGDGTFTDVTSAAGLAGLAAVDGFAPRFADMNGDRYPEIIWIGDFGTSAYYVNDGEGTFTNFTAGSGTSLGFTEMGMTVADVDEDGRFDFYVTTIADNKLYINQGGHAYVDAAPAAGVVNTAWGWGTVAIDFDHDSLIDLVATTQSGSQFAFRNTGTPGGGPLSFQEVSDAIGLVSSVSGRGLANLDYDNDGDQDLVIFPHDGPIKLFRNDLSGPGTSWIRIFLDAGGAPGIPPDGIGSVVRLTLGSRTLFGRIDGGSNYLSQSEMSAHFGLGAATSIDKITVQWSNGDVTVIPDVAVNQTLVIERFPDVPGDATGDGIVGIADLLRVLGDWGPCAGSCPPSCDADLDEDCAVGVGDLLEVLGAWDG